MRLGSRTRARVVGDEMNILETDPIVMSIGALSLVVAMALATIIRSETLVLICDAILAALVIWMLVSLIVVWWEQ